MSPRSSAVKAREQRSREARSSSAELGRSVGQGQKGRENKIDCVLVQECPSQRVGCRKMEMDVMNITRQLLSADSREWYRETKEITPPAAAKIARTDPIPVIQAPTRRRESNAKKKLQELHRLHGQRQRRIRGKES